MSDNREREVTKAFVTLASSLAQGYDVVELLSGLAADCARLLDVHSAGLLLADRHDVLHVLAASTDETRNLEIIQLQRDEGPCLDCYRNRAAVNVTDLRQQAGRWPRFTEAALEAGFASVHALPMRLGDSSLGTLGLFGTSVGALNDEDLLLGQALADVASVSLLQNNAAADQAKVNQQLQTALDSRIVIEQAKGLLAEAGGLTMDQAFARLRSYSRDHNERLSDIARRLISRELPSAGVLQRASRKQRPPTRTR